MSEIDYRKLLKKYITHVSECEGVTFINDWRRTVHFTNEEWDELELLDEEARP